MGVSRSGYYKWKNRDKSERDINREEIIALVSETHEAHPSHGYRWVAAFLRLNYGRSCSDSYIYKVFRCLGIQSQTKHKPHYRPRKESSPDSCVKCYTMFLPFLLIKIDVFS